MEVNIHDAKTNLSKLIAADESGEEVIIARNGKPAVKLVVVTPFSCWNPCPHITATLRPVADRPGHHRIPPHPHRRHIPIPLPGRNHMADLRPKQDVKPLNASTSTFSAR
jgi:prevent-host-death family protein